MTVSLQPRVDAPLHSPAYEHDSCGVGLVVDIAGKPSRTIVERALAGLVNLTHRGGVGADPRTGDGAGILLQVPHALFAGLDILGDAGKGDYGVAMAFLPRDEERLAQAKGYFDTAAADRGLEMLGWREVPVDPAVLSET
ncbi:MAG: hypothetical protein ACTHMX_14600, partial [Thermomicrobiales bacterium]